MTRARRKRIGDIEGPGPLRTARCSRWWTWPVRTPIAALLEAERIAPKQIRDQPQVLVLVRDLLQDPGGCLRMSTDVHPRCSPS